jgi:hypothetical protein
MISAWHLLWIVPLSGFVGIVVAALCFAAGSESPYSVPAPKEPNPKIKADEREEELNSAFKNFYEMQFYKEKSKEAQP